MARRLVKAEVEVAAELGRRGIDVSARQVARWREEGIIRADRGWPGGGGSTSRYSAEMIDVAETVARVLKERRSLRDAVLILFGRGVRLETDVLKAALLEFLEKVESALSNAISKGSTPTAIRRSLKATKEGRAMLRFLEDGGLEEAAFVNVCEGLAGRHKAWIVEFINASGFATIAGHVLDDETCAMLDHELGDFTIPAIKSAVIKASREQLERALVDAHTLLPFIAAFIEILARGANEPDAFLLDAKTDLDAEVHVVHWTAIALWARERGVDLDAAATIAGQYAGGLAALVELARTFSWARGPLFGPDGEAELAKLHSYEQRSVAERVQTWLTENPERAEAISSLGT